MTARLSKNGKPLGRPKKNSGVTFKTPDTIQENTILIEEKPVYIDIGQSGIECELLPVFRYFFEKAGKTKSGRYMTGEYSIEGFRRKKWVVGAYIKADFNKYKILKMGNKQIIEQCLVYLNSIGGKKKKYSNLGLISKDIKFINKDGVEVAPVEMTIEEKKNPHFWKDGDDS